MRIHNRLFGLVVSVAGGVGVVGCGGATGDGSTQSALGKDTVVVVSNHGSQSADLDLSAIDRATGKVTSDQSITLSSGSTSRLVFTLPASSYSFDVKAYADAAHSLKIGETTVQADVQGDSSTELQLLLTSSADGTASGSTKITGSVNVAPKIDSVTATADASGNVTIHVAATGSDNANLHFFYSGFGISGTASGSSSFTLTAAAATAAAQAQGQGQAKAQAAASIHILVADDKGGAADASVDLSSMLTGATSGSGSGGLQTSGTIGGADANAKACLDSQASCNANCAATGSASLVGNAAKLAADASCISQCSVTLATCESK